MSDPAAQGLLGALPTLRSFARGLMLQTCQVQHQVSIREGGTTTKDWQTLFTSPCRLQIGSGNEQDTSFAVQARGSYTLHLPLDSQAVEPKHRVVIAGRAFNVVWTPPVVTLSVDRKVGLEEVTT